MNALPPQLSSSAIRAARPQKHAVDPWQALGAFVEPERTATGEIVPVATLLLANRECPFTCVFCDLWQQTLDEPTPLGAIPAQIAAALVDLPPARQIKLYNAGNFFDPQAIPPADWDSIATLLRPFEHVVVENHPRLTDARVLGFQKRLTGRLEVALGLETVHPEILPRLNKAMTVADFERAAGFLVEHDIAVRVFVILRLPGMSEAEGIEWALRSIETAFNAGASCVSVIPGRNGPGVMTAWSQQGLFAPPLLESLYTVMATAQSWQRGRVFGDLWEALRLGTCPECTPTQIATLSRMNHLQRPEPWPVCRCGTEA
jgi:radical SAM enzyme (TIGR01210 family)